MSNPVELYRTAFSDTFVGLYGSPNRPVLTSLCSQENKQGSKVGIDGIASNPATVIDPTGSLSQKTAANLVDLASFQSTFTSITGTTKQRTWVSPSKVIASDLIREEEDVLGQLDPQAPLMKKLMGEIWIKEDGIVVSALTAASASREQADGTDADIGFSGATVPGDGATGVLTVNDLANADAEFRTDYIMDDKYVLVSPSMYAKFKNNNRSEIQNIDYVGTVGSLETGNVEKIEGFKIIVSPSLTGTTAVCFTAPAVTFNTFKSLKTDVDILADRNYQTQLYARSYVGACRNDDEGVVWIDLS